MPKEVFGPGYQFLKPSSLLSYEEIARLAGIFVGLGVGKIRLTGGEPLVRRKLERLIEMLAAVPGLDLALTTNGSLLESKAQALKDAGLQRITVSLDSLDDAVFAAMNGVGFPVGKVLAGIEAASVAGLWPVKINMVVKKGLNDDSVLPMARFFRGTGHILRFIEYMDVGNSNGWQMNEVVTANEIVAMIDDEFPLEAIDPGYQGEVAKRWRYRDGSGEIGVIASVSQPFCRDCTRARLSSEGELYTCLFATRGHDLRGLLRSDASDADICEVIAGVWQARGDRYSETRSVGMPRWHKVEMSHIGG
jgi:cyclic pyranopterin phosphate synthase